MTGRVLEFGERVTGRVADDNDWTASGPRLVRPARTVTGTVVGIFGNSRTACKIQTGSGEIVCVRVTGHRGKR